MREPTDEEFAAAGRAWDRMNAEAADEVKVGTCLEHERLGIHVFGTYEDPVNGDEACVDFRAIPNFAHECSENGNAFGGYNCTCGEPWLTNGCMTQPTPARLVEILPATMPWELLDHEHPDHDDYARTAGRCFDDSCPRHQRPGDTATNTPGGDRG